MPFKIVVTKTDSKTTVERGAYGVVGREYISQAEYDQLSGNDRSEYKRIGGSDSGEPVQYEKLVYGYTPPVETTKEVTTEIYTQIVDELNLVNVINGINSK